MEITPTQLANADIFEIFVQDDKAEFSAIGKKSPMLKEDLPLSLADSFPIKGFTSSSKKNRSVFAITLLICLGFGTQNVLEGADNGVWVNNIGGDWTTNDAVNWKATPGTHPNGTDAISGFVGFPNTAPLTITSTNADITLATLHIDTVSPITIDFSTNNHKFIFSDTLGVCELVFMNSSKIIQGSGSGTRISLASDLDVFVEQSSQPLISGNIDGTAALSLYGSNNPATTNILLLSGSNSYTGGTNVFTGILALTGSDNITVIPQAALGYSFSVFQGGHVHHVHNNHYASTVSTLLNGGSIDLLGTHQIMTQIKLENGAAIEDATGGGTLELLQTSPGFALVIGSNSIIGNSSPYNITLHGGGIQYDNSIPGPAFFAESATFDLGGTVEFNVPHNRYNCFDVDVGEAIFQNDTLNKTGDGTILFQGGTVPNFNIQEGTVIIGDPPPAVETITATGLVTVSSGAVLGGFQTLDAQGGVINSGTVLPGSGCPCDSLGQLTINGNYTQIDSGVLEVKALSPTNTDLLIVQNGAVSLAGTLSLESLPGADLKIGDKILVLDNTIGANPSIDGQFASLLSNLPPQLTASILQDPNQIFILIGACSLIESPSLAHFINLSVPLTSGMHSLQQRERILYLRKRFCEEVCPTPDANHNAKELTPCAPLQFYIASLGSVGNLKNIHSQRGYDFGSIGGLIGGNYACEHGGFGLEAGYEKLDGDVFHHWGKFDIQSLFGSVYFTCEPIDHFFINLSSENRSNWYKIHRHIDNRTATGRPHSWQWDGYFDAGYDFLWKTYRLTPLASLEGIYLHIDDYLEHGADDFNLQFGHQNFFSFLSWLGMSASGEFSTGRILWIPEIRGYWLHDFANDRHKIRITSPTFNTTSRIRVFPNSKNYGVVGGDLRILLNKYVYITGSYDFNWNNTSQSHWFYGEFGAKF